MVVYVRVCGCAVNGLNNFQIGFPSTLPTAGSAVSTSSYDVCGSVSTPGVASGLVITLECASSAQQYRYVIVQSLDTSAEQLCIAEIVVDESQCPLTFTFVHQDLYLVLCLVLHLV